MDKHYWSIEACGWVASPGAGDALVTPWSGTDLCLTPAPHPLDAEDLLRTRGSGPLPAPRGAEAPVRH